MGTTRAGKALADYNDLPLTRHGHTMLVELVLDMRANFSAYDATCIALAERLGADLLTADAPLARAAAKHTGLRVLSVA